ncbi:MAG: Rpn family recombination-promoting nuclease/putative transposase, partial [Lachnospiraceae bacterium]|nr:Rpn family recombination-promoting nuclease/putative transposase [Lachnospiraceae bacterium]
MRKNKRIRRKNSTKNILAHNKKYQDNSSRLVFEDPILCAQFLRDYVKIPMLQSVRPEDIEDVTERYLPLFTSEREADTVKRIKIDNEKAIFLISLIEHKTKVDYNVIMKLLRYMCYIWEDYEKEKQAESDRKKEEEEAKHREKGSVSAHKDFKYPPILPIVYFEGSGKWTAVRSLKDRINLSDIFEQYIPDFSYELVRLHDYSNDQLMEHSDEMSLIMLLNKLQSMADLQGISQVQEYKKDLLKDTPQHLIDIIGMVTTALLNRMSLPQDEIDEVLDLIKERKMPELFECFEKVDVPKMREEIRAEKSKVQEERRQIQVARRQMQEERRQMQSEKEQMQSEKEQMQSEKEQMQSEKEQMQSEKEQM